MILSKKLKVQLCRAGIDFLIVCGHMIMGSEYFELKDTFLILNEEYKLFKLKRGDAEDQNLISLPANMCYTITTTGTTNEPKLIHVPYDCIAPNILALSKKLNVSMADIIYLGTPCTFDPFVVEFFLALQNGAAVFLSPYSMRESPTRLLEALLPLNVTAPGITILQATPSLFRMFGAAAIRDRILNTGTTLRVLLLGGEPFPCYEELKNWMDSKVVAQKLVCNIYGITEISCWSNLHILQSLEARVPLGLPIDSDTVLRIVDKQGRELQGECSGELMIGSSTRRCYIPETDGQDKADCSTCCFRATGDYVHRYDDGSICYEDRTNDVVKRIGKRISLGLISRKIQKYLDHQDLAVCLWQQDLQKLICCIRTGELKTKLQQRVQTHNILSKLMASEQPDRFVYVQQFPCNTHGKLDRKALLNECVPLMQPAQKILKSFLHDTLKYMGPTKGGKHPKHKKREPPHLGYDISFRQAGGTSFHAVTLSREIGLQMCVDDEQRHLFEQLLDDSVSIREVLCFLDKVKIVSHHTKLKPIESESTTGSSCSNKLSITRMESSAFNLKVQWKVNFKKCVDSAVAQWDDRYICVGAHSKLLCTLDALSGAVISSIRLPDRIECKVRFVNEHLAMVGCYDGYIYGFQPLTGEFLWSVEIGGMIKAQPLLTADKTRIVVCSYANDYNVMCLSADRQCFLWCLRIGEKPIIAAPLELPLKKSLIICTLDGTYACIASENGKVQWKEKCKEPFFATPVLLEDCPNIFLCAEVAGRVHACDTNSGKILASYSAGGNIFSSLLVKAPATHLDHAFVLFGCIDQFLYCLECKTHTSDPAVEFGLRWKLDVGAAIYGTPTLLTLQPLCFLVCCCATDGRIVLANLSTGQVQYSEKLPGQIFSTPCHIEGQQWIYVGCRDNFLYCLRT
ncbi:beta-alanine-activating enzyme isoform X2 [Scaptodrosophila lebanonensis]|nr:beta-alanine-activating enzyme isoform X2 [Scaptodrosophila lebanonensis]